MESKYKRQAELFDIIWSEKRVKRLLDENWEKITGNIFRLADDINKTNEILCGLKEEEKKRKYVKTLSPQLVDCLLIKLVREMKKIKEIKEVSPGSSRFHVGIH